MHVHWGREIQTLCSVSFSIVSCIALRVIYSVHCIVRFCIYIACSTLCFQYPFRSVSISFFSQLFPAFWNGNTGIGKKHEILCVHIVSLFIPLQSKTLSFVARNFLICIFPFNGWIECERIDNITQIHASTHKHKIRIFMKQNGIPGRNAHIYIGPSTWTVCEFCCHWSLSSYFHKTTILFLSIIFALPVKWLLKEQK